MGFGHGWVLVKFAGERPLQKLCARLSVAASVCLESMSGTNPGGKYGRSGGMASGASRVRSALDNAPRVHVVGTQSAMPSRTEDAGPYHFTPVRGAPFDIAATQEMMQKVITGVIAGHSLAPSAREAATAAASAAASVATTALFLQFQGLTPTTAAPLATPGRSSGQGRQARPASSVDTAVQPSTRPRPAIQTDLQDTRGCAHARPCATSG